MELGDLFFLVVGPQNSTETRPHGATFTIREVIRRGGPVKLVATSYYTQKTFIFKNLIILLLKHSEFWVF